MATVKTYSNARTFFPGIFQFFKEFLYRSRRRFFSLETDQLEENVQILYAKMKNVKKKGIFQENSMTFSGLLSYLSIFQTKIKTNSKTIQDFPVAILMKIHL